MAIGRISGPMLVNNLERQGVDLVVDTNLVYFDVTNRRVGLNNNNPLYSLDSSGNVKFANLIITGNTITSNTGKIDLGTVSNVVMRGGSTYENIMYTDGLGNLNFANINTLLSETLLGNTIIGNVDTANVAFFTNVTTATSNATFYPAFYTRTNGNSASYVNSNFSYNPGTEILAVPTITATVANITTANIATSTVTNFFSPNIRVTGGYITGLANASTALSYTVQQNATDANVSGTLYAGSINSANVSFTGVTTGTVSTANISLNAQITNTVDAGVFFPSFYNTDLTGNAAVFVNSALNYEPSVGNLTTNNFKANSNVTANVLVSDYILPNYNNSVHFSTSTAIKLPTGNTAQRPPLVAGPEGTIGYFRYNTQLARLEYNDGDEWISVELNAPAIGGQSFYGDGINTSYPLDSANETAQSVMVSVNGTTQVPDVAYSVTANVITFAETVLSTDLVDIRFLSVGTTNLGGNVNNDLRILSNTSSTDTTTGALIVQGGVGIVENLNVGGFLNVGDQATFTISSPLEWPSSTATAQFINSGSGTGVVAIKGNTGSSLTAGVTSTEGRIYVKDIFGNLPLVIGPGDGSSGNVIVEGNLLVSGNTLTVSPTSGTVASWIRDTSWAITGNWNDIFVSPDGLKLFVSASTAVNEYDLVAPFDISTVTPVNVAAYSMAGVDTATLGLWFNSTGTKMYTCGQTSVANVSLGTSASEDRAYEFNLDTPWNVNTATVASSIRFSAAEPSGAESAPSCVYLDSTLTTFYMGGSTLDRIHQYTLSTPGNLTTASYVGNLSIGIYETGITGLEFNTDQSKMYIIGSTGDDINEFALSTPGNVMTATYVDRWYTGFQENAAGGLYYNDVANVAYNLGTTTDTVYKYRTNVGGVVLSAIEATGHIDLAGDVRVRQNLYVDGGISTESPVVINNTLVVSSVTTGAVSGTSISGSTTLAITGNADISSATTASQIRVGYGATTSGVTKSIQIGTSGASGSFTNVTIGSETVGALGFTKIAGGNLVVAPTTASTSTTTGALVVAGGAGVAGDLFVAGSGTFDSGMFGNVQNGVQINNDSGAIELTRVAGNAYIDFKNQDTDDYDVRIQSKGNTNPLLSLSVGATADAVLVYNTGNVAIAATTTSTSSSTGALVVNGGVGVAGNITLGFNLNSSTFLIGKVANEPNGVYQASQYFRLANTVTGANVATTPQRIIGAGVAVSGSTQYEFEGAFYITKSAGVVSHRVNLSFGGTAGISEIGYSSISYYNATSLVDPTVTNPTIIYAQVATATIATVASTTAIATHKFLIKGHVSVSTPGTFIPQYSLTAAGGIYTTAVGSYFKISPFSGTGGNVVIGQWS